MTPKKKKNKSKKKSRSKGKKLNLRIQKQIDLISMLENTMKELNVSEKKVKQYERSLKKKPKAQISEEKKKSPKKSNVKFDISMMKPNFKSRRVSKKQHFYIPFNEISDE